MTSLLLALMSALLLPLLSLIALLLRRQLLQGKGKYILLGTGVLLLLYAVSDTLYEHYEDIGFQEIAISSLVGLLTLIIVASSSRFHTHHQEEAGAKGIVLSEAFHSLIDGAVIGGTYLVNPLIGGAATLGIIIHESPKILGTIALLRSLSLSVKKTILYSALAQGGAPIAALFVYLVGKQFTHEHFHMLELASMTSLFVIIVWIIVLEIHHHKKHDHHH